MAFRISKNIIQPVLIIFLSLFSFSIHSQIVVNSVNTTAITCPNNGSISISATTTVQPLLYSIISGPVTQPVQTNPIFNSLPPGNYVIKISDGAGNQTTRNTTISGTYLNPTFNISTTTPYCFGNSNGQLAGNINAGTGTPPFLWQLVAPSPITTTTQVSNTFNGLPAGNYAMRVTDACGSFSSNAVSLQNPVTQFSFLGQSVGEQGSLTFMKIGCDSMLVTYWLTIQNPRMPLSFKYNTSNGVYIPTSGTTIDTTFMHTTGQVMVSQIIPGGDYGQSVKATIYNTCGDSAVSMNITTHPYVFYPRYTFNQCGNTALVTFTNTPYNEFHTSINAPVNYVFTDASNHVLQSSTVNVDQNNGIFSVSDTLTTGGTYHFSITDGCGETFTSTIIVPELAPPVIIHEDIFSGACIDSVVGAYRILTSGFQNNAKLILLSGPSELGSTKPEFTYSDTYTYPDTVPMVNGESFMMNNLSIGTYQYKIIDDCGNEVFGSFTIYEYQLTNLKYNHTLEKGCPGKNKIYFSMVSGGKVTIRNIATNAILTEKEFIAYTQNSLAEFYNHDSLINLFDGSYEITYQFLQSIGSLENSTQINDGNIACWLIVDTIHIAPYHVPEMLTGNAIMCNNTINFVLMPDTTKGVAPYQYEIIAGPQTFLVQNSNIFTINQPGTYTARIFDKCGNASIKQITVDTISFDPIEVHSTCHNTSLIFPSSIYDSYQWLTPNSFTYDSDSLIINPITPADTGIYHITKFVDINGCKDTLHTTYHITLNIQYSQTIHFCQGSTVTLGSHVYTIPGIYSDTLTAMAGCDSIVISNLVMVIPEIPDTVLIQICSGDSVQIAGQYYNTAGFYTDSLQNQFGCYDLSVTHVLINNIIDTVAATVCSGGSYNFGNTWYTSAGYYSDTLVSMNGCDSVSILHLSIVPYVLDSISRTICAGTTFSFAGTWLNQTGIYTDTIFTNACDTIKTLTLNVLPYISNTVNMNICAGTTYTFGGNILTQGGVYIDTLTTNTCDSIVTLTLSILPYKYRSVSVNICAGEQYLLGGNPITQTGIYVDTLSTNTCDSIVTLNLTVLPYKYHSYTQTICEEQNVSFGGHIYTLPGTYTDTLSTSTCDSIVTLILKVTPLKRKTINASICAYQKYTLGDMSYVDPGTYIQVFHTNTCDSIITLNLQVSPAPLVNITYNATETIDGAFVQFHANSLTNPLSYLWASSAIFNNYSIQHPTTNIQNPTWVHVTVTAINGCTGSDSLLVLVPVTPTLYIPNCYTPNGDGTNEGFRVYGTHIDEFEMMIFNRWGELIFKSTNMDYGWNGTYMGESVQNGLYVYKVVARGSDKTLFNRTGHVSVVR